MIFENSLVREGAKNILRGGCAKSAAFGREMRTPPIFEQTELHPPQTPSFKKKIAMSPPQIRAKKPKNNKVLPHIWGKKGENQ